MDTYDILQPNLVEPVEGLASDIGSPGLGQRGRLSPLNSGKRRLCGGDGGTGGQPGQSEERSHRSHWKRCSKTVRKSFLGFHCKFQGISSFYPAVPRAHWAAYRPMRPWWNTI